METIKIIIVDDHKIIRDGLRSLLLGSGEIEIIAEAGHGYQLFDLLKEKQPDVIVLDIALPKISGIEITKIISKDYPRIKILILTANTDEHTFISSVKAGAKGFLPKNTSKEEFVEAVKIVYTGKHYFGNNISETLYKALTDFLVNGKDNHQEEKLSAREIDIIRLFALGHSYKEIAERLYISTRTVETHKNNILKKLGLKNTVDLVKYAIKEKIIEL